MTSTVGPAMVPSRRIVALAWAGVAGAILFNAGWLVAGWIQGPPYSPALHDVSDLGALTARSPWVMLVPEALAGVLTIGFALAGLRPALLIQGRGEPVGAWLVAASLMGLDNVSDLFFRLPCMAVEPGCTIGVATAHWPGKVHYAFGISTALVTAVAPFFLASRMRLLPYWRHLARGAIGFGGVLVVLLVAYIAMDGRNGPQGYLQRGMALLIGVGIIVLARRLISVARDVT